MKRIVPDIVQRTEIVTCPLTATVQEACEAMAAKRIGAVVVGSSTNLAGIFTERDLLMRVVAKGLIPRDITLEQVMTPNPDTLGPDADPFSALQTMREHNYRHLPVVEDGRLIAMVSIRDLYAAVTDDLEGDLESRDALMFGQGYGLG